MRGFSPSWGALSIALILSTHIVVPIAAEPTSISVLKRGSPEDDDLPTKIQRVAQGDHLLKGESDTAIIDDGSDVGKEDYRNTDDWDPAQEDTAQIPSPRTVATWVLRQVKIGGKNFINAFDASLNQKFIFLRNSLKKANELKCVENTKASGK